MKTDKEAVATKAMKIRDAIKKFEADNSFTSGKLTLTMNYDNWAKDPKDAYYYSLSTGQGGYATRFSFQEMAGLKAFLNSVQLVD